VCFGALTSQCPIVPAWRIDRIKSELIYVSTVSTSLSDVRKSFGGFSIIFAGDFRHLKPICLQESDLMLSIISSTFWQNNINAIIILDNEDSEYEKMLKGMWEGSLTTEYRKRINTRVIGHNGLELPSMLKGKYKIDLFKNNICVKL
jgi:hypothetical protein